MPAPSDPPHGPYGPWGGGWSSRGWGGPWQGEPPFRMPRWAGLWIPVILSFLVQVPAAAFISRAQGLPPEQTLIAVGLALIGPLALIGARRFPGPVVAVVSLAAAVDLVVTHGGPPYLALAFAVVSAIVRDARLWAWISVGVAWIGAFLVGLWAGPDTWNPFRIAVTAFLTLIVFGLGEGLRARRDRIREYRRRQGERRESAVQQERVRIARELHDVLAHSLSQINVQAGVGLHLLDRDPEQARVSLGHIRDTSKVALDEVRSVLGFLRSDGDPAAPRLPEPGLDRLPELIGSIRNPELAILLDDQLGAHLPGQPVQLAVYRIVQESLTNAARHAEGATRVDVTLRYEGPDVVVEVRDDGTSAPQDPEPGGGLLGMRERAELLGGHLDAAPVDGGGFRVRATLPTGEAR